MTELGPAIAVVGPNPGGRITRHRSDLLERDDRVRYAVTPAPSPAKERFALRAATGPDELHSHVDNEVITHHLARGQLRRATEENELAARPPTSLAGIVEGSG